MSGALSCEQEANGKYQQQQQHTMADHEHTVIEQQQQQRGGAGEEGESSLVKLRPTEFGQFVLTLLERNGRSLRGLVRATGMSFDRLKALLYGRVASPEQTHAMGSTFLLTGLYRMADYLGVSAVELLVAFYGQERAAEARMQYLLDRFLRLSEAGQNLALAVIDAVSTYHACPLSEETACRLSSLSLGRGPIIRSTENGSTSSTPLSSEAVASPSPVVRHTRYWG